MNIKIKQIEIMKAFTFKTENELKSATTFNMGTNPVFKFGKSDIKSINGIELRYCEISNKHITYYAGGGETKIIIAPFNVVLK